MPFSVLPLFLSREYLHSLHHYHLPCPTLSLTDLYLFAPYSTFFTIFHLIQLTQTTLSHKEARTFSFFFRKFSNLHLMENTTKKNREKCRLIHWPRDFNWALEPGTMTANTELVSWPLEHSNVHILLYLLSFNANLSQFRSTISGHCIDCSTPNSPLNWIHFV